MFRLSKRSKAQASTEVSYEFMNFEPGQQVQYDLCEYNSKEYMLIADEISGFFKVN